MTQPTYPKIGATVRIHAAGFDPARTGIYVGITDDGHLRFNTDPQDLLPAGSPHKETRIPLGHEFEVLA